MSKQTWKIIGIIIIIAIIIILGMKFAIGYYDTIIPKPYKGMKMLNKTIENTIEVYK